MDEKLPELMRVCRSVVDGEIEIVEAARLLVPLLRQCRIDDENASVIVAVESETDDYPLGSERERWDREVLRQRDTSRLAYVAQIHDAFTAAWLRFCRPLGVTLVAKSLPINGVNFADWASWPHEMSTPSRVTLSTSAISLTDLP